MVKVSKKLLDEAINNMFLPKILWWRKTNKKKIKHKILNKLIKDMLKAIQGIYESV